MFIHQSSLGILILININILILQKNMQRHISNHKRSLRQMQQQPADAQTYGEAQEARLHFSTWLKYCHFPQCSHILKLLYAFFFFKKDCGCQNHGPTYLNVCIVKSRMSTQSGRKKREFKQNCIRTLLCKLLNIPQPKFLHLLKKKKG